MTKIKSFFNFELINKELFILVIPVSLQSVLQEILVLFDQIMVGQLGEVAITAVGLTSNFTRLYALCVTAIAATASILSAQYIGANQKDKINKCFQYVCGIAFVITSLFAILLVFFPDSVASLYTSDTSVIACFCEYSKIYAVSMFFNTIILSMSAILRSFSKTLVPMILAFFSATLNVFANYLLITGNLGFPRLEVVGTAIATLLSKFVVFVVITIYFFRIMKCNDIKIKFIFGLDNKYMVKILKIAIPISLTPLLPEIAENIQLIIYSHIGTSEVSAMLVCIPPMAIAKTFFSGFSVAAITLIGKEIGREQFGKAYNLSKSLIFVCLCLSILLGIIFLLTMPSLMQLFSVEDSTRQMSVNIMFVFVMYLPIKRLCSLLIDGILPSGGKTRTTMLLETLPSYFVGLPLACLSAFVFQLPIHLVYATIALEDVVKLVASIHIFRKRKWIAKTV